MGNWRCADGGTCSPYKPIEKDLNKFWLSDMPLMDLTKYADAAVKKVTGKSSSELIWLNSTPVWWSDLLNLMWLFSVLFAKEFGLNKVLGV